MYCSYLLLKIMFITRSTSVALAATIFHKLHNNSRDISRNTSTVSDMSDFAIRAKSNKRMFSNGGQLWLHIHLRDIAEVRVARIVKSKNGSRSASIFLTAYRPVTVDSVRPE